MDKGKKKINYNYAFVFYDVNEKRVQKVLRFARNIFPIFSFLYFGVTLPHPN